MPLSIFCLMLIFAAWNVWKNNQKMALKVLLSALLFVYLFSSNWFSYKVWQSWEGIPQDYDFSSVDSASAVVVLGGFMDSPLDTRERYFLGDGIDRLVDGVRAFRTGKASYLIVSGGRYPGTEGPTEASLIKSFLNEFMPLPDSLLLVENQAANTWENATYTAEILEKKGMKKSIILVTSASHMRRSLMVFEKNGFIVQPISTDFTTMSQIQSTFPMLLFPTVENLLYVSRIWREFLGYMYYSTW